MTTRTVADNYYAFMTLKNNRGMHVSVEQMQWNCLIDKLCIRQNVIQFQSTI